MDVSIKGAGWQENIEAQVDPTHNALRVNLRPTEHAQAGTIGGHFNAVFSFSNTAAGPAANSDLLSLRWTDSKMLFVLKKVVFNLAVTTAFTTAQAVDAALYKATAFTASPSGGTALAPASVAQRSRSANMAGSLIGNTGIGQISSGAALTAGTRTLDTYPSGYAAIAATATVGAAGQATIFDVRDFGVHPIVLGANEGIVIQNTIANGAAGVAKYSFTMSWAEVPVY